MKYAVLIFLVIFMSIPLYNHAQMSGVYTIGATGCNFTTFQEAINELITQGTSGDVDFQIMPGNYADFYLENFETASAEDSVTFQAFSTLTGIPVIRGEIKINNSKRLFFNNLLFEPFVGQQNSCVEISGSCIVTFDSCKFVNPYSNCFTTQEALLSMHLPFTRVYGSVLVKNTLLSSSEFTIYASGAKGVVSFLNDTINGAIDIFNSGFILKYTGNVFNLTNTDFLFTGQTFRGNIFNAGFLYLQGDFYDNQFYCSVDITAEKIYNNHFMGSFRLSHNLTRISHNIFENSFFIVFASGSTIDGNQFFGEAGFSGGQMNVIGNLFHDYTEFATGPSFNIKHNNFHPDALLFFYENLNAVVENNNIGNLEVRNVQAVALLNNNYIPHENAFVNAIGSNPFFYDPGYISLQDLHATNPALIRKSTRLNTGIPGITYDIDSNIRKAIPTIGANEICFDFQTDTTNLLCDSLCLDLCTGIDTGCYWSPGVLFTDSTSRAPVIRPEIPVMVYLNQPAIGKIDSLFLDPAFNMPIANGTISIANLTVHVINTSTCFDSIRWVFGDGFTSSKGTDYHVYPDYGFYRCTLFAYNHLGTDSMSFPILLSCLPIESMLVCGDSLRLETCIDDFSDFYWSPGYLFKDSSVANPVIFPEHDDYVILNHIGTPGFDYMHLRVYPVIPKTSLEFTVDSLTVHFTSTTKCADSVRWDFGDGASSTEGNPVHQYSSWGTYNGFLYGFSLVGSDTSHFSVTMTGMKSPDKTRFRIWPNPVHDILNVASLEKDKECAVLILDIMGRQLYECPMTDTPQQINLSALEPGVYFIQLKNKRGSVQSKITKQ